MITSLAERVPPDWRQPLGAAATADALRNLDVFLAAERVVHQVFPPPEQTFCALELTPHAAVRVVVLGQDPYHDDGQAHGLAFSVRTGIKPPPSLVNVFKERETDLGLPRPSTGCLVPWARQGVLLLNTVLTVRAHAAASHQKKGWEPFTDAVIDAVARRKKPAVFVLWGAHAQKKIKLIETAGDGRHVVIATAHPSPLSVRNGFFGSRPFSRINAALREIGHPPIDWTL